MQIHDRKDQLIHALAAFQATFWIGLFSVGFWQGDTELRVAFWAGMGLSSISLLMLFLSALACFYYPKHLENSDLFKTMDKKERADAKSKLWKVAWNWHWIAFVTGGIGNILSISIRFYVYLAK